MIINQKGIDLIKEFEGLGSLPYEDSAGYMTIGYGHRITKHENFYNALTGVEAETLLHADLLTTEEAVNRLITVELNENQFAALVSFTFNLGSSRLMGSTLKQKVNAGLFEEAAEQFLRWNIAGGEVSAGLTRRREAEKQLFLLPI